MKSNDIVSVITVTYNSLRFLDEFFTSVLAADTNGLELEIVMVDNGSTDDSVSWTKIHFPMVRVMENDRNNYVRALNRGIREAKGEFLVISNNDARVHSGWLTGMLEILSAHPAAGAAQSKILFAGSNTINSVGVQEIERCYFEDVGFDAPDTGQYDQPREVEYISGGSVMFRRPCLEDVGDWDEDFIMYFEDIDYSLRCRRKSWQLWCAPASVISHRYHGSASNELCKYLCSRNRFFFIAKHYPLQLAESIRTSHLYKMGQFDFLYRTLLHAVRKLCICHETSVVTEVLAALKEPLVQTLGEVSAYNFFSQLEVLLGLRKIRVGIYDHACHFAGGGQRYVAEMAAIMQDRYDVTYIANKDMTLASYKEWFDLDLSRCGLKIIKIPFFEERDRWVPDEGMVLGESYNVFDIISAESLNYDIFINANMLGKVNPLSQLSLFLCHFPDRERAPFFQVHKYDYLVTNGDYTGHWLRKRWGLTETHKLYPPVNMYNPQSSARDKERIILSVSRFEVSGSKKQYEMVKAFAEMCRLHPEAVAGWRLVLVGGSLPDNHYLAMVEDAVNKASGCPIDLKPNASVAEVRDYYRRAAIFWHACGLEATRPELVEHFGMTTVEAMQNYCVPIVIDGGGQREIVEQGESGFRFASVEELQTFSLRVMGDDGLREQMAQKAYERSALFSYEVFSASVEKLLAEMEDSLLGEDIL